VQVLFNCKLVIIFFAGRTSKDVKTVLDCLDIMVNKRKRQVTQSKILQDLFPFIQCVYFFL